MNTHPLGHACDVDHGAYLRTLRGQGQPEALIDALAGAYARLHLANVIAAIEVELIWAAPEEEESS